ncbi:MAG TPA: S1C family serine protease [Methylomirabilota bacterium]|jgi:S1-C subfamily serine protease|nr:S1C family serine protease [Methylomirabilota bacterium]
MSHVAESTHALSTLSNQFADAVEQIGRAVVQVDGRPRRPSSGVVYAPHLVIVAEHAVERDDDLHVEAADGPPLPAQLLGRDPPSDLAVLRVPGLGLEPAALAATPARVGQFLLAVGRPGHRGLMASIGVVSAVSGPLRTRGGMLEQYIRTDATPYPGFSGGALVDARGAVLGVLTTGLVGGVALAVPAALAWRLADTLARQGYVTRGWLGIGSQPVRIPPAQRAGREHAAGLLIVEVAPESPAEHAGLLLGDILVALDGRPVADAEDLQALLVGDRVGRPVPVEVLRGGVLTRLEAIVGQRGGRQP